MAPIMKVTGKITKKSKNLSLLIRIVISLGLVLFLLLRIDLVTLGKTILSADLVLFIFAILLSFFKQFLEILRLYYLLRAKNIRIPLWPVIKIMVTGTFIGTFTPTSLGVEIVRAYGFTKHTSDSVNAVSAVAINRFVGFISLMFLASLSVFYKREYAEQIGIIWIILIFAVPFILIILGFSGRVRFLFEKKLFAKIKFFPEALQWLSSVGKSFYAYRRYKKTLLLTFFLSIAFQVVRVIICYILAVAIDVNVPFVYFFIITPLVMLFTMLPLSVGGIGVREGSTVYFLGKVGINPTMALSVSLMCFIVAVFGSLPGLLFYLRHGLDGGNKNT